MLRRGGEGSRQGLLFCKKEAENFYKWAAVYPDGPGIG
jgi:hypothetical protein